MNVLPSPVAVPPSVVGLAWKAMLASALLTAACAPPAADVDCATLADEQPACMDAAAIADCEEANDTCGGDVAIAESCPLQFGCATP